STLPSASDLCTMAGHAPARPPPPPHQLPPGGQCFPQPAPGPRSHGVGGSPQPPRGAQLARDRLAQQLAEAKTGPRPVPRLRVVVESQAFKNILVDEMDMMLARAATLIQANWRRYRLRQKLISQVTAARAIQEAWRRFSMRRLLRSSRSTVKRVAAEEGDIPYHAPQQVRFQPQGESQPPPSPRRRMLSKETQFPSCDSLAPSSPWLAPCPLPPPPAEPVCPAAPHTFLPPPTAAIGFPCPVGLDPPCQPGQPCLLTETVRSTCLVHVESNVVKAKPGAAGASRVGSPEPPPQPPLPGRYGQAVARPLKIQTQVQVETETFKSPLQMCPEPAATKTPPKASPVPPAPTVTTAKAPPQAPVTKAPAHMCPAPGAATKTPIPARPAASVGSVRPQPRPVAAVARIPPQVCLLASMFKPLPQARHMALMGKTPPPPARPAPKSSSQTSPAASSSKTSSQACPVASATKPPAQMRLAAMLSKTPAQVATVLRTLCLSSPAAGTLKAPPQAGMAAGVAPVHPNTPKAKAPVANARQAPGAARAQPHPYLAGGKVRCFPQPHPGAPAGAAGDRPPPEAERVRAGPQRQRDAEVAPKTGVPVGMTRMMSWTKVVEEGHKDSLQTHLRTEVYVPVEMAGTLPQGPPVPSLTKALCQERPPSMPQGPPLGTCSAKASSQLHLPTKVTKAPSLAHLVTCLSRVHSQSHLAMGAAKFQSQGHLPSGLTKAQSQAQLVTEAAKCLFTAHPAADLTCKAQSQPLLAGPKAAAQPCLHPGARAKLEDRLTLLQQPPPPASKTPQGPRPVSPESQGMLVPVLAAAGQPACNVESWGDGGPRMAPPPLAGHAAPCQEDMAASQLASLCAELAAVLGSQEDLRALLAKALSQGEVRAALNQALSREVLGATVAKALPQGLLGMVLVKALSWSELGVTLTRALSRGELRAELTKAMQGRLAEVLSKALTEEERAALSQALCQGELGAVLSQSLSQAALRTGAILPKAASKVAGSGVTPVAAVDCRGTLSAPWGPALGLPRSRCSKGPVDAGVAGGRRWSSAPARDRAPWEPARRPSAVDPRLSPELMVSMQTVEAILIRAVTTIQAGARGYLVRRAVRVWHVMATVIQAHWRGYRVRRNLARLYRATTLIQAAWRGYCTRRDSARRQRMLLPVVWAELRRRSAAASDRPGFQERGARAGSEHRCFQSCQPRACSLCQSLGSGVGGPPSVVMLVGSSPRTCHTCGHTQPTRVVQGVGRGAAGQGGTPPWSPVPRLASPSPRQLRRQNQAATSIQSAWRGFRIRRQVSEQQKAAKMVQANWRGHYTRNCLTTDALLGRTSPWASSQHWQTFWPGV
uniref:IQ motif containing N n=1 Tax=Microcebus murinus TaxID=30608 RepID=A0A8C5YD77_MICMU